jgi:8-oxo-dGTP pyrophosphatase MutT (NUDIX family)
VGLSFSQNSAALDRLVRLAKRFWIERASRLKQARLKQASLTQNRQVGALPLRVAPDGGLEVLLITSRDTGRWVIPKGWPSKRLSDSKAAAREAKEEAGLSGTLTTQPIGQLAYMKRVPTGIKRVSVDVFAMFVDREGRRWAEQHERQRQWFGVGAAAAKVRELKLRDLLSQIGERVFRSRKDCTAFMAALVHNQKTSAALSRKTI